MLNRGGGFGAEGSLELGRVLGWLVGDGTIKSDRAVLSFFGERKVRGQLPLMQDAREPRCSQGASTAASTPSVSSTSRSAMKPSSVCPAEEIAEEHGLLEEKLQVPESVLRGSREMQLGFLQALFTADGHVEIGDKSRGAVVLTSKSPGCFRMSSGCSSTSASTAASITIAKPRGRAFCPTARAASGSIRLKATMTCGSPAAAHVCFAEQIGFLTDPTSKAKLDGPCRPVLTRSVPGDVRSDLL